MLGAQVGGGGPSRQAGLEFAAAAHAAAVVLDDFAQGDAEGEFVALGALQMPGEAEQLGPGSLLGAGQIGEPAGAAGKDVRHVGQGFDVVDRGRLVEQSLDRRKRRLGPGVGAFALETVEKRGLFAKDVAAGTAVHVQLQREAAAEDVPAEQARFGGFGDGPLEVARALLVGVADEDVADRRLQGIGRDDHPLDQLMGVGLEQFAVLVGPRFHLVAVADQVFLARLVGGEEGPLHAGGKAGAAAAAQSRGLDRLAHLGRAQGLEGLLQPLVAAAGEIALEEGRFPGAAVLEQKLLGLFHPAASARSCSRISSTVSGVSRP